MHYDYTTIGHVTADVLEDGSRRAGGTAFYAALQASRLGLRTLIRTRGRPQEIEELLAPWAGELELEIEPASATTTLLTTWAGGERAQRVLAWAGEIEHAAFDTAVLHLAPVARESPSRWSGHGGFVGLTPQGLLRVWGAAGGTVTLAPPARSQEEAFERSQAIALSEVEQPSCAELLERARRAGALIAVTAGAAGKTLLLPDGDELRLEAAAVAPARDDLGAGDVFAAALFAALHDGHGAREAGEFAACAAALRVEGDGPGAIAARSEIDRRVGERRVVGGGG